MTHTPEHPFTAARFTKADAFALAFLALMACALMTPFVVQGKVPLNADFALSRFEPWWHDYQSLTDYNSELDDPAMYIYPTRELAAGMLRRGIVPLWNPYILCGTPLLADSVSLPFDPFGVFGLFLPFPTAWGMMILAQLLVAGWSMYALMRHYGCSPAAGTLSGVTLMLCATFTVWLEYISWIGTFCWAPLCLLLIDIGIHRRRTLPFVGAALLMAFTIVGGLLQLSLYFFAMMGFYALWQIVAVHIAERRTASTVANVARLAGAFALAVLLACVQLLPTLELAALTYRAPGRYVGANHLPLAELLTYVAPNLYGHPTWHDQFYTHAGIGGMLMRHGGYIAIVPLVLALFALVQRRREGRVLCHGVLSFGNLAFLVLLGFGLEPLLLAIVPQFGGLHAKRQVVVYSVSAAVLAGFGLDALLAAEWRRVCIVARAVAIAALALLAACVALDIYCRIAGDAAPQVLRSWQSRSPSGILALYRGVGSAVLLLGLTWATIRFGRHTGPRTWSMCLVALASVDLFAQARLYNPFVPRDWVYPPTDAVTWLRRQPGMFRISGVSPPVDEEHPRLDWYDRRYKGDSLPPNTAMPLRLYDARGRTSLFPRWIREYAERVTGNDDIRVLFDYRADEHRQHMVNLLGARYVLSPTPLAGDQFALVHDAPLRVYENKRAVPHVFVASEVEVVADDAAALRRLATEPPPLDHVLVDRELPPSPASSLATAEITSYEPNEVRVRITTQGGGYLVLSDTWFPGWNAYADGEPRPIARANYLMRCVPLKATDTEVRFVYEPQAFRTGLFLSLTGLGIAFALAVVCFVARSRREAVQ